MVVFGSNYGNGSNRDEKNVKLAANLQTIQIEMGMKVLIVSSVYPTAQVPLTVGGAEVSTKVLAESLASVGHQVEVVRATAPNTELSPEVERGVIVYSYPVDNLYWTPEQSESANWKKAIWHLRDDYSRSSAVIRERIEKFQPDVLHTHTCAGFGPSAWIEADKSKVAIIHTLHDYYLFCPKTTMFRYGRPCDSPCFSCRILTMQRRKNSTRVDAVIGVSKFIIEFHQNKFLFSNTNASVIHPFAPTMGDIEGGHRPVRPAIFGFIGRASEEKGIFDLCKLFLQSNSSEAILLVAGRIRAPIKQKLLSLDPGNRIKLLGYVERNEFYRMVDIVVVPSLWNEPYGMVIKEAQSAGKRVIVSNRGGGSEALGDASTAWLFDPDKPGELWSLMVSAMQEKFRKDEKKNKARSENDLEVSYAKRHFEIYERALIIRNSKVGPKS